MTSEDDDCWVVYSRSESATDHGAGFWSSESGWAQLDQATHFSLEEALGAEIPASIGRDARFVTWLDAQRHYRMKGTSPSRTSRIAATGTLVPRWEVRNLINSFERGSP